MRQRHIGLCRSRIRGAALRREFRRARLFSPPPVAKLDAESSGYGLSFVVLRFDGEAPPVARFVEVIVRTNQDHEGAVRRQDTAAAGDFAVRCVGHPRFDAVAQAPLAVGNLRGKGDGQLALRVELAGLLEDLLAGVIVALAAFFLHRNSSSSMWANGTQ